MESSTIDYCKVFTCASHEVVEKVGSNITYGANSFIKVALATGDHISSQSWSSVCSEIYDVLKSWTCQRFTVIDTCWVTE